MAKKSDNNTSFPQGQNPQYPEGQQPFVDNPQQFAPDMNYGGQNPDMMYQQQMQNPQMYNQPLPNQPAYQQPSFSDPVQNLLYTPPAGIYPKTDSMGRVIKYKKRGGVFPFFMGLFTSLFVFIFCIGFALTYFFYCVKLDDITGTFGVDTGFLPVETNNKTIKEVFDALWEYKDDYTNMTLQDLDDDFGVNIEDLLYDNLGITITGLYDIEIAIAGVNGGDAQELKDIKIQDIVNNMDTFIDQLIPEVYKRVSIGTLLDFAHIDLTTFNYPIFTDALFDVTPNPIFAIGTTTYQIDFNINHVLDSTGDEFTPYVAINASNQFTINSVTYTINDAKTTLTYGGTNTINLVYTPTMKTLSQLSIYQVINSVVPNYVGGDKLTIGFIQTALGLNLIPDTLAEDPDYEAKYGVILNTVISDLQVDEILDSVTIRTVLELAGIDFIPLDDARYDALLDSTIGTFDPNTLLSGLTAGAVLDLIPDLDLSAFLFINDDLKAQYLADLPDYMLTLTVGEIIAVPETVYDYSHFAFTEGGTEYYILPDGIYTYDAGTTTYTIQATVITSGDPAVKTFELGGTTYTIDETNAQILNGATAVATINSASSVTEQLLYSIKDITIQDLMDGNFDIAIDELYGVTLENLMGENLTGILANFKDISLGEIIDTPEVLLNAVEALTIGEVADIDDTNALLGGLAGITLGDVISTPSIILDTISTVTLADLGISATDPLLGNLSTLTIGDIMEDSNSVLNAIRTIDLSDLGISPTDPLLGGLADISIGAILDDPNTLTDAIQDAIDSSLITDFIPAGNFLIDAIVAKADETTPATIANLPTLIDQLNLGDLGITDTGIISLLSATDDNGTAGDPSDDVTYTGTDIPLTMIDSAFNGFSISSQTLCNLFDAGILPSLDDTVFDRNSTAYTSLSTTDQSTVEGQTLQDFFNYIVSSGALANYIATLTTP